MTEGRYFRWQLQARAIQKLLAGIRPVANEVCALYNIGGCRLVVLPKYHLASLRIPLLVDYTSPVLLYDYSVNRALPS